MNFKIVAYDKQTHGDFPAAMVNNDYRCISVIQDQTTWREIEILQKGIIAALHSMDVEGIAVELMVINDVDTAAFPLRDIFPERGVKGSLHPQLVATRAHQALTTTKIVVSNDDITALMKLLPLGNSSHSGLREKLHQASLTINRKK